MKKADITKTGTIFNIQKYSVNDGPGIRTVVFFKGCPLRCKWCANPESQSTQPQIMDGVKKGEIKSIEEILKTVEQDRVFYEESDGGITLSGGEILAQPDFAAELLLASKEAGLHTCCETTGFAKAETFDQVTEHADLILFDMKHWNSDRHKSGTGVANEQIISNMKRAVAAGKEVLPRIPVIPGFNDSLEDAAAFASLLKEIGLTRAQLLPFHQFGENKYHLLKKEYAYEDIPSYHREDLEDFRQVFIENGCDAFF